MVWSETCLVNIPLFAATGWSTCWYCLSATAASDTETWILPPPQHNPRLNSSIVPPITKPLKERPCQVLRKLGKGLTVFNPLGSLEPTSGDPLVQGTHTAPIIPTFLLLYAVAFENAAENTSTEHGNGAMEQESFICFGAIRCYSSPIKSTDVLWY